MWLDADDVLTEESRKELIELKRKFDFKTDIYFLKYRMGKESDFVFYRERIFKQNKNYKWISPIHEVIEPSGNICYSDIEILHEKINTESSERNLKIFLKMKKEGQPFDSRQKYYFARELYYHKRYEEAEEVLKEFLREGGFYENEIEGIKLLAELYLLKNNRKEALKTLFTSFYYGEPKGEICVLLGNIYVDIGEYTKAIKWYKEALRKKPDLKGGGFCSLDCYGYIPCVQLCVCHYRLGNVGQAVKYNNLALKYKPDGESAIFNRRFFEMRRQNNKKWLVKKPEL